MGILENPFKGSKQQQEAADAMNESPAPAEQGTGDMYRVIDSHGSVHLGATAEEAAKKRLDAEAGYK